MVTLQWLFIILQTPQGIASPKHTPTPSPTPDDYLPSIGTAVSNFFNGITGRELSWMAVSLGLVIFFRMISKLDIRRTEGGSGEVVAWILGFMCWCTVFYLIGYHKMIELPLPEESSLGMALLVVATAMSLVSTLLLHHKTKNWRDILSGTIIGLIGFAMEITFVKGLATYSYAILFGCILGIVLGGIYFSYKRMYAVERGEVPKEPKEAKTKTI